MNDLFNPLYIKAIARTLAAINCLDAPINKKSNWLIDNMTKFNYQIKQEIKIENVKEAHKEIAEQLLSIDYQSEIEWIKKHILIIESPIVFCNNDIFPPNILVRNDILDKINKLKDQKDNQIIEKLIDELVIIDFEFCSYNFRGCEIGNFFGAHEVELNTPDPPHFIIDKSKYPNEQHQRNFIKEYLNKVKEIKGELNEQIDNEDHILKEVEAYQIAHLFFWLMANIYYTKFSLSSQFTFDFCVSKLLKINFNLIFYFREMHIKCFEITKESNRNS